PGVEAVLSFYSRYQKPDGSLRRMPWWNFVDWVKQWPEGVPPAEADGSSSAALDLQLVLAYQWAADLEEALASPARAGEYREAAEKLKSTVLVSAWDATRGIFADQPSHRTYSQQVNTLAVLAHVVPNEQARGIIQKIVNDTSLAQASIYFRAYMNSTLREVGLGSQYLEMLGPWREMLGDGLTTWAEWNGSDARSDCHAWGASPNIDLFRTLAGIESAAPGFSKVRIAPNPGTLPHVVASMPHPAGEIRVDLHQGKQLVADVELPPGIGGQFVWDGASHPLQPGRNHLELPPAGGPARGLH
ncbi:MAG TPA: alpha-L-rhamnosidase C-terminal domain-containing protein, partial [Bryobacteraceae bacterium]|nr:alpha-L-rhamnosidase C-terminal domain-containing protein [Bryobacteraceae bacterium]